jgi:hypothetical protein
MDKAISASALKSTPSHFNGNTYVYAPQTGPPFGSTSSIRRRPILRHSRDRKSPTEAPEELKAFEHGYDISQ